MSDRQQFLKNTLAQPFHKAQLHIHTSEDPYDHHNISYSAEGLILLAREHGYHFVAITNHNSVFPRDRFNVLRGYARQHGIILIPGVELRLKNKDVLIYFDDTADADLVIRSIHSLNDVRMFRLKEIIRLVIIPHPFFHLHSFGRSMNDYLDMIDGIEFNWFYTRQQSFAAHSWISSHVWNMNEPAERFATAHHLPLAASGDLHKLDWFDKDYTLLRCKHDLDSFLKTFTAIKKHHLDPAEIRSACQIVTTPLAPAIFRKEIFSMIGKMSLHYLRHPSHIFGLPDPTK